MMADSVTSTASKAIPISANETSLEDGTKDGTKDGTHSNPISESEDDGNENWTASNRPLYRTPNQIDSAILSCGPRPSTPTKETCSHSGDSPHLSSSAPDVRTIRYSKQSLLDLRESELSKRRPEHIGRAWSRIGISGEGDPNDNGSSMSRFDGNSSNRNADGMYSRGKVSGTSLSASSSNSSLANTSSSSYLLPLFACKRRPAVNEMKRTNMMPPKKDETSNSPTAPSSSSRRTGSNNGNSANNGSGGATSLNNSYSSNSAEARSSERRIGSGRIPMRDTWNDFRAVSEKENSTKSATDGGEGTQKSVTEKYGTTYPASSETEEHASSGGVNANEPVSFRPSGGLLGLRDRQRENDQQTQAPTIPPPVHQHMLSRTGILGNSILDKDRTDFRERVALGGSEDRYERRSYNRDRGEYGMSNIDKERNTRMSGNHHSHNNNSRYGGGMGSHSHYSFNSGDNRRRMYNDSRSNANEEPEWFSGGPTSQNDTIELRGFDDPPPRSRHSRRSPICNDDDENSRNNVGNDADAGDENDDISSVNEAKLNPKSGTNRENTNTKSHDSNNNKNREAATDRGKQPLPDSEDRQDDEKNASKGKENFNFEDFLKLDSISDLLTNDETFKEIGSGGESRFSRWFRTNSPGGRISNGNSSHISPTNQNECNQPEKNDENYFSPISPAGAKSTDPSESIERTDSYGVEFLEILNKKNSNDPAAKSFLEFLQRRKFNKQPSNEIKNADSPVQSTGAGGGGQIHSVEELEARLRHSGPTMNSNNGPLSPSAGARNNMQNPTQDTLAFKKLLEQMSNEGAPTSQQPSHDQIIMSGMHQSHADIGLMQMLAVKPNHGMHQNQGGPIMPITSQHQHQHAQIEEYKKIFPFGHPQAVPNQQQSRPNTNQPIETMKKLMIGQHAPASLPLPFLSPQTRIEILKRPEAQNLLKGLSCGEINQAFLLQHLHNPNTGQRERELFLAVLSCMNQTQTDAGSAANGSVAQPAISSPNLMANQHQIPNAPIPAIQPLPNNAPLTQEMIRHLYYQAVPGQKQQLRISPLPNGIPQRIPSPRELQVHTQSIMQNALIKKKLEEQRENFRKRQEQQQQQQQQQNNSDGSNENQHQQSIRSASPIQIKQINQNQHVASPTPTLAFTPTSVLRKMTAEKDSENGSIGGGNIAAGGNIKDTNKQQISNNLQQPMFQPLLKPIDASTNELIRMLQTPQRNIEKDADPGLNGNNNKDINQIMIQQQLQQHQQQQQQNIPQNVFHPIGQPGDMQMSELIRMLQGPGRIGDKDIDNVGLVNGNNKDMTKQLQQQQQQQMFHPGMQHPAISAGFRIPQGPLLTGQAAAMQQNKFSQMLPNNLPPIMPQHHQVSAMLAQQQPPQMINNNKPPGRPIVKGGGMPNQFPSNIEFQQVQRKMSQQNLPPPNHQQMKPQNSPGGQLFSSNMEFQQAALLRSQQQFHQAQFHHMMQQQQQQQQHQQHQQQPQPQQPVLPQGFRDGALSPTSNQLARWFSPELLAQASAGKLPSLDVGQALSLEEFERNMHSSTTVHN